VILLIQLIYSWASSIGGLLTTEGALLEATQNQTYLAGCKVRLFQGPALINYSTTHAQLLAVEATYEGYPAGGNTIAAWGNPLSLLPTGWGINSETTFAYVDAAPHTANTIVGGWIEDSTGALVSAFNFPTPVTLNTNGNGLVLQLSPIFGRGN